MCIYIINPYIIYILIHTHTHTYTYIIMYHMHHIIYIYIYIYIYYVIYNVRSKLIKARCQNIFENV